ncbi:DUF6387 family protein [Serratia marcescens]|uniref:DUF6387 family protein n=1 Tax=Serratia marcescens TaxID=615 RepID=UPI000CDAAC06|nr:DUF6387 family protein [Serratia marcescens]POP19248.1 hypothetical protein C3R39_23705 [Serratia marcescens]POP25064.1 hypothetical protein C3R43_17240 [Serratia marcescens]WLS87090.1 DUF6387 family protein [Serratia marcescens]HAT3677933.1 hypothetical protein [Serratia marcescens]
MAISKSKDEFEQQLSIIEEKLKSSDDFFSILRENKLSIQSLAKLIDVKKYDDVTKDFELIQYYISFEKRREALSQLDYIDELEKGTYEECIGSGNDAISEKEFLAKKESDIAAEKIELLYFIERIISGDNAAVLHEDLTYADGWQYQTPIRLFDIKEIAFENQRNGLLGGMENDSYNEVLSRMISGKYNLEDLKKYREIPDGYGWPTLGLNQRVWAEIDVNTPDDILIEAFKNFIKDARSHSFFAGDTPYHLFSEGEVKGSHIKKWHSLRVLAYLDLKIFARISGSRLTMKQYGDILYFDNFDIDNTEKVRKTLIPLVSEIFSGGYLNNLLKKIIAENQ